MADMNRLRSKWQTRASAASADLVDAYINRTGKLDAARSENAEKAYAAGVQAAVQRKTRQKALARISEEDLNRGMREKGGAAYANGVATSADKWERQAAPYIAKAEEVAKNLPARTADPTQNVTNRVMPVVKALHDMKHK